MSANPSIPASNAATRVVQLPIEMVRPDAGQARTDFDHAALTELAESIAESGVIQPVLVCGAHETGYRLLAGERRWRAAQQAGLSALPAIIRNDLSAEQASVLGLIENLQRESLGVMDTARGLARLCDDHELTHDAIAQRIGKSRVYVTNFLRLRQLAAPVQQLLESGALQLGHAKILAGLDKHRQITLARRSADRRMSVRALERAARDSDAHNTANDDAQANGLAELETRLAEHVGNAVKISYDADRRHGELRIAFHDLDEFDGLLARLGYVGD